MSKDLLDLAQGEGVKKMARDQFNSMGPMAGAAGAGAARAWNGPPPSAPVRAPTYAPRTGAYKPPLTRWGDPVGPPQIIINRVSGDAARDQVAQALRNHFRATGRNWTVQSEANGRIYLRTPHGARYLDILIKDEHGVAVGGIEVKLGGAQRDELQERKDAWLKEYIGLHVDVVYVPSLVRQ